MVCRDAREHFTRKYDRVVGNRDVLNRLLVASDPVISSLRSVHYKVERHTMTKDMLSLLKEPSVQPTCLL